MKHFLKIIAILLVLCMSSNTFTSYAESDKKEKNEKYLLDFYTNFFDLGYARGKELGIYELFNQYNVAYDINEPSVTLTNTSYLNYTATASDDVEVVKIEWYLDGVLVKTTRNANTSSYTVPSYISSGTHSVMVKAYDQEAVYRQSEIREKECGTDMEFFTTMPLESISIEQSTIDSAFEDQEIDSIRKNTMKSKASTDNIKNELKDGKAILRFSIDENSDIIIDGVVDGALDYIKVVDAENKIILEETQLIRGEGIEVDNLPPDDYEVIIKTKDTMNDKRYFINIYSKPSVPELVYEKNSNNKDFMVFNSSDNQMIIEINGKKNSIDAGQNENFTLDEGMNTISYYTQSEGVTSDKGEEKIYIDTIAPIIEINGIVRKDERLIINGSVNEGLKSLEVDGEQLQLGEFGNSFAFITKYDDKITSYTIIAEDYYGNVTTQEVEVN